MYFYISKSTGRNISPQNLIQDWPLTSIELNVHPQDFLSSSGLHCSLRLNKIQQSSENSHFIFSISKGSVSWEFGSLRLLGIESFGGAALKLLTAASDYFCRNSLSLEVFECVFIVNALLGTFQRNRYVHDLTWKTLPRRSVGFQ